MTVAAFPPYTYYWGDGVTRAYAYPFEVERPEEFLAWQDDLLVTNYQLSGVGNETGGLCTFSFPPAPGASVVLMRRVPLDQETMYPAYSPFPAAAHEKTLDRLCMQVWQMQEQLERASRLKTTIRPPWRNLVLPDPIANTVLGWDSQGEQWTLYPSGVTQIQVDPVSGIGWGKNTVAIMPVAGSSQASALVFPPGVLAVAVTAWIQTTLGSTQGLQQVGLGTVDEPDCWGVLPTLTAGTATTAGIFLAYGGQPVPGNGLVALTAYGGLFDGTGTVYVTGHFMTFSAAKQLGFAFHPGAPEDTLLPPPSVPLASELEPGIVELLDGTEVLADTDLTRALTIGRLVTRTATEGRLGLIRTAAPAAVSTGTNTTDAVTPATLRASQNGTPLSVLRYRTPGPGVEATPTLTTTAAGALGVGATPETDTALQVQGNIRQRNGYLVVTGQDSAQPSQYWNAYGTSQAVLHANRARNTEASPQATQLGDVFLRLLGKGHDGTAFPVGARTWIDFLGTETWTATQQGSALTFNTTLTGTTTQGERLRIDGQGNLTVAGAVAGTAMQRGLVLPLGVRPTGAHPTDAIQAWVELQDGVAGQAALKLRSADGTITTLGPGFLHRKLALTLTASGVGAPYAPGTEKSGMVMVGNNGTETTYITLPAAAVGLAYTIINFWPTPRGTRVVAQAGTTIRIVGLVSTAGGYCQSQVVGSFLTLVATGTTAWTATCVSAVADWTVG